VPSLASNWMPESLSSGRCCFGEGSSQPHWPQRWTSPEEARSPQMPPSTILVLGNARPQVLSWVTRVLKQLPRRKVRPRQRDRQDWRQDRPRPRIRAAPALSPAPRRQPASVSPLNRMTSGSLAVVREIPSANVYAVNAMLRAPNSCGRSVRVAGTASPKLVTRDWA
jgi:hypothetical protein